MQPADEGDDDRREAVAGRHQRLQLADRPGDLAHAGDAGRAAAEQHAEPDHATRLEAGIAGGRVGEPADRASGSRRSCG